MSYWEERQIDIFKNSEMSVGKYFGKLEKSFIKTQRQLRQEIDSFYVRYAKESGISYADAKKELNKTELGELKDFIELSLTNIGKYNKDVARLSLKSRITRLEALETRIDLILRELYAIDYEHKSVETLKDIYKESYLQSVYALDKYKGVHSGFVGINEKSIEKLIAYPFNGLNFSSRVWKQKEHLKSVLMEDITRMLIQGKHPNEFANDMAKKLKVKRFEAYRLLHTESSFLTNEATMQAYKDDGMEKYQILGTLDKKTCSTCGEQDNKIYELEKGIVGVNQPPFHPLCRCTTVPYFEDEELENETRTARDKDGNYIDVPADMSYREWKEKFADRLTHLSSDDKITSRVISGARNPYSYEAKEHANRYYGLVRSMKTDVSRIANSTGFSEDDIQSVKNYIFLEKHDLGNGKEEYFEPDFMMAESWRRLIDGTPEPHDIVLLNHEIMEKRLITQGYSQSDAHSITSKTYNYDKEAGKFYDKIKKYKTKK